MAPEDTTPTGTNESDTGRADASGAASAEANAPSETGSTGDTMLFGGETTETAETAETAAAAPKKRAPRRATKKAAASRATKAAAKAAAEADPSAAEADPASPDAAAAAQTNPENSVETNPVTSVEPDATPDGEVEPELAAPAPAKKAVRKRATRKQAAPKAVKATKSAAPVEAPAGEVETPQTAAAETTTARPAAAPGDGAEDSAAAAVQDLVALAAAGPERTDDLYVDPLGASVTPADADEEETDEDAAAAEAASIASFNVLFQAPVADKPARTRRAATSGTTTPRRRRATAVEQAPAAGPEAAGEPATETGPADLETVDAAQDAGDSPDQEQRESAPATRTRRSRRGEGRRRAQDDAERDAGGPDTGQDGTSEARAATAGSSEIGDLESADAVSDADSDTDTDTDTDIDTEGAASRAGSRRTRGGGRSGGRATRGQRSRADRDEADASDDEAADRGGRGDETADGERDDRNERDDRDERDDQDERDDRDDRDDEGGAPRRSRRRRGGKGRRGRGAGDDLDGDSDSRGESRDARSQTRADSRGERTASDDDTDGRDQSDEADHRDGDDQQGDDESASSRRRRRRRRAGTSADGDDTASVSTRVRQPRTQSDEPVAVRGSTRLEAKKQRRREGREAGRRRTIITEAEFLARREAVDRVMVVRNKDGRTQMGVLEDGVLVEHYIDQATNVSMAGNIYLGRVQNVLPSMEAAFVDIGKGRNAVLYAGEVNWDAAGLESNQPKRIEHALSSGQAVLVQVTKDPIGHKGARLTSQISLPGRYLVYVPNSSMTGISRKLPDTERARLKKILRDVVPDSAGVIVRTAAEGASEAELRADVERLTATWEQIQAQAEAATSGKAGKSKGRKKNGGAGSSPVATAPVLLHGEPDLTVRVIRDVFNEDFKQLVVAGEQAWEEIHPYISSVAPDLADRVTQWTGEGDLFTHHRVDEQLAKAMDRKVWLPSGGSLVIDRTEAMTVVDVNTGKFVGSGGNLEETVTKNNIEAAEEIVRQLRLRDIGGIIVVDFIDMVLESNRDLVVRRLLECLGRDRTKHQVAEVTSLGLVQMTRKRVGSGLIEVFGETCDHCNGRGFIIHSDPVDRGAGSGDSGGSGSSGHDHGGSQGGRSSGGSGANGSGGRGRRGRGASGADHATSGGNGGNGNGGNGGGSDAAGTALEQPRHTGPTAAQIAAAAHAAALKTASQHHAGESPSTEAASSEPADLTTQIAADLGDASPEGGIDRAVEAQLESVPDVPNGSDGSDASGTQRGRESGRDGRPHAFPQDDGPWAGEDVTPPGQVDATSAANASVELESDVPDAGSTTSESSAAGDPASSAPARGRRRRGRVVAPAGPPRGSGDHGPGEQA